jgi:prepilin-type N-terminal cleavage/methylation domain
MVARGFSLVEMIIVLAIGGVVIAIVTPGIQSYMYRTRVAQVVVEIGDMSAAIRQKAKSTGSLPDSLDAAGFNGKVDPWGFPYQYVNLANSKGNGTARKDKKLAPLNSDFDLYSVGRDGRPTPPSPPR